MGLWDYVVSEILTLFFLKKLPNYLPESLYHFAPCPWLQHCLRIIAILCCCHNLVDFFLTCFHSNRCVEVPHFGFHLHFYLAANNILKHISVCESDSEILFCCFLVESPSIGYTSSLSFNFLK